MNWEEEEVLRVLRKSDEPISISEISRRAMLSRPNVYNIMTRLLKEGKVEKELRQEPQKVDFHVYSLKEEKGGEDEIRKNRSI